MRRRNLMTALLVMSLPGTGLYSCALGDRGPTALEPVEVPVHILPLDAPFFKGDSALRQKIRNAEARYSWVARMHSDAVREAAATRMSWPKDQWRNRARTCAQAFELALKYAASANVAAGKTAGSNAENWNAVRRFTDLRVNGKAPRCVKEARAYQPPSMSVFATPLSVARASLYKPQNPDIQTWLNQVQTAYNGAGYYGLDMLSAVVAVVESAASQLSEEDLSYVVALADFTLTSTADWQDVEAAGGGPGGDDGGGGDELSIFKPQVCWGCLEFVGWLSSRLDRPISSRVKGVVLWDEAGALGGWWGGPAAMVALGAMASIAAY